MSESKTKRKGLKWGWKRHRITMTVEFASTDFEAELLLNHINTYGEAETIHQAAKDGRAIEIHKIEIKHEADIKEFTL